MPILWSFAEKGAEVNCETNEGVTPLHDAVDREDSEIVQLLLKNNASPLIKAEKG
jgi:ankyrin repeat protein